MKRLVVLLCMAVCIMAAGMQLVLAEELFDYRRDTKAYCEKVSALNLEAEGVLQAQGRGDSASGLVLFRMTEELAWDSAAFEAQCVVYGPRGFAVLMCDAPAAAVEWLLEQEGVVCAEVDSEVSACTTGEETTEIAFQSWGAEALGMGDYVTFASQWGSGSATVAVIDSGVFRHSLISPKLRTGGHDYVDNDSDSTNDLNGHGTRVAGIVADCTRGLPVYIYPIRVLNADASGKMSNVVSAVLEATSAGVDVINLSLSSYVQSETLESAIRSAVASGITVVVAAGNEACDASEVTPAKMTDMGVIVVGSAEQDGSRSYFSNYGTSVDVYVYGRGIVSCSRSGGYVSDTGTSMAAPHVSALSAMLNLTHPSLTPYGVETMLRNASSGSIRIPSAGAMVPRNLGFSLSDVALVQGAQLLLPAEAAPATARQSIAYVSADPAVADAAEGILTAKSVGSTQVTVSCCGFEDMTFTVTVSARQDGSVLLPAGLTDVDAEAFLGLTVHEVVLPQGALRIGDRAFDGGSIGFVTIPDTVKEIGNNSFSGAVLLCGEESAAQSYAVENGLQYIVMTHE